MTELQHSLRCIVKNYSKWLDELELNSIHNGIILTNAHEVILKVRGDLKLLHIYLSCHKYDRLFDLLLDTQYQLSLLEDTIGTGDGIVDT